MIPRIVSDFLSQRRGPVGAWYNAYCEYRWGDPCLRLISSLADRKRLAIDVGANVGTYSFFMRRYACRCIAYECNPNLVEMLRYRFGNSIDIRAKAVSDKSGDIELRIPKSNVGHGVGRATIEPKNSLAGNFDGVDEITVRRVTLDDEINEPVGLIKIDVEGHEIAVLRGAQSIIDRDRPTLIIELEDRHNPGCVDSAFSFFAEHNYRIAYLRNRRLTDIDTHSKNVRNDTVNYIFIPR